MFIIKASKRDPKESNAFLRQEGKIPAVFYGAGKESTPISISNLEFKKIWKQAGESSTVKLSTGEDNIDALIHEVQVDPVTNEPIHADFLAVDMNKKIKVEVELVFEGISGAVKGGLGNLVKVLHEIEIEALPKDLPHNLSVDISKLEKVSDTIFVSDIKLPTGVVAVTQGTDVVASIIEQKEEKEEIVVPVDLTAIEVEKKGKKEEEGAEGAEASAPVKEEKIEKTEKK